MEGWLIWCYLPSWWQTCTSLIIFDYRFFLFFSIYIFTSKIPPVIILYFILLCFDVLNIFKSLNTQFKSADLNSVWTWCCLTMEKNFFLYLSWILKIRLLQHFCESPEYGLEVEPLKFPITGAVFHVNPSFGLIYRHHCLSLISLGARQSWHFPCHVPFISQHIL